MNTMHTHKLNLRALPPTKSKDRIFVMYNRVRSNFVSAREGLTVHCYDVLNQTKRTASEVEFFTDADGQRFGRCNCDARVICKHITKSAAVHVARMRALQAAEAAARASARSAGDDAFWRSFARS